MKSDRIELWDEIQAESHILPTALIPIVVEHAWADETNMQLSAELFSEIVQSLHSDERQSPRHEKRREGRVGISCSIDIRSSAYDDKGQKTERVRIRDISAAGMGFISHGHFEVGLALTSRLPQQDGEWLQIKMTVRRCTKVASGLYTVGASFEQLASTLAEDSQSMQSTKAKVVQLISPPLNQ